MKMSACVCEFPSVCVTYVCFKFTANVCEHCASRCATAQERYTPALYRRPLAHTNTRVCMHTDMDLHTQAHTDKLTTDCTNFNKVGAIYLNELNWCTNGVSLNKVIGLPTGWEFVLCCVHSGSVRHKEAPGNPEHLFWFLAELHR